MFSHDSEIEGVGGVSEVYSRKPDREAEVGNGVSWEGSRLRDLKPVVVGILDFEGKVAEGHAVEGEEECLDDGTGGFTIVVIRAGVGQSEVDGGGVEVSLCHLVLGLGKGQYK